MGRRRCIIQTAGCGGTSPISRTKKIYMQEVQQHVPERETTRSNLEGWKGFLFNGLASPETSPRRKGAPRNFSSQEAACDHPPLVRPFLFVQCAPAAGQEHEPLLRTPMDCIKAAHRILASAFTSSVVAFFFFASRTYTLVTRQSAPACRWERSAPTRQRSRVRVK
ncbi:hypothetical protein COCSADRAFT_201837 [Bipolaris sorokiniana ND90Pr]|uniref:Uncharacterized protein n=1 Tax=Cochliobolus sativus (strain ND90Pr / ATCC 201652) TaxID=665912 RepID=M2SWQ9_COCSN|nr:uncharacterized protein COCSADRAFT_201837 [Bipolaris sorokiniana ND90Pr]EMD61411.1 hypothetical protein COCSADRAFT_201837 [Bipolaris sorokiniana ND90Pr]